MFNAFVDWLEGKCKRFTRFYSALALVVFLTLVTPVGRRPRGREVARLQRGREVARLQRASVKPRSFG